MAKEFVPHTLVRTIRQEPNLPLYLGLMTTNPMSIVEGGESIALTEVNVKPYARQPIKLVVDEADRQFLLNHERIFFAKPEKKYGFMTHIAIFDKPNQSEDNDNMLLLKSIGYVLPLEAGRPIIFEKNELRIFVGEINPSIL
jgi:hypothetical protein